MNDLQLPQIAAAKAALEAFHLYSEQFISPV